MASSSCVVRVRVLVFVRSWGHSSRAPTINALLLKLHVACLLHIEICAFTNAVAKLPPVFHKWRFAIETSADSTHLRIRHRVSQGLLTGFCDRAKVWSRWVGRSSLRKKNHTSEKNQVVLTTPG